MKVYLDNMMVSALYGGRPLGDSAEQDALEALQQFAASGRINCFSSAEHFREIDKTVDHEMRERIRAGASIGDKVSHDLIFYGVYIHDF